MTVPDGEALAQVASLRVMPRQARGREKLTRLLDAADRLLAAEGADAITTTRIAAEAGISVGSVYRYLPHREAIIEALAQHYLGLIEQRMDEFAADLAARPRDPYQMVDDGIDTFAGFYRDHPGFRALWFGRHLTAETMELDRAHKLAMATRIRAMFVGMGIGRNDKRMLRIGQLIQLATDAVIQEAFRADPNGDKPLLDQLKVMIRGYVGALVDG